MTSVDPPRNYEDLIRLIHERHDTMSKSYKRISVYLTQNPNDVAVHTVNAIAERCGVHASSFVRYAQSFGYKGFKELQALFQTRLATAAPGFDTRVEALKEGLSSRPDSTEAAFLRELVVQDIATLQGLLDDVEPDQLADAAERINAAETIYVIGQLRSAPVAELLRYMLTMIGKRCVLLDPGGGLATHMARTMTPRDVLIATSFRYYANEVVSVVEKAAAADVPVVAITDSSLSPLAKSAQVLFAVPEREDTFVRSLTAPICLAQALTVAVAARVQKTETRPRIPTATES